MGESDKTNHNEDIKHVDMLIFYHFLYNFTIFRGVPSNHHLGTLKIPISTGGPAVKQYSTRIKLGMSRKLRQDRKIVYF